MQLVWILPSVFLGLYMALTTGSWQFFAMSVLTAVVAISSLKTRSLAQLKFDQPIEYFEGRFWVGSKKLPKYRFLWRREWNHEFFRYFQEQASSSSRPDALLNRPEFFDPGEHRALIGYSGLSPLNASFADDGAHLLLIGPTGSGKSVLLKIILSSLACGTDSKDARFGLIDFKGGATFGPIVGQRVEFSASDLTGGLVDAALTQILNQIQLREELLQAHQVDHYLKLNRLGIVVPTLYIFVDEFGELLTAQKESARVFETVAQKGRSLGLILIAANQSLRSIPRSIQLNMRQKIALTGTDPLDMTQLGFRAPAQPSQQSQIQHLGGVWRNANGAVSDFRFPLHFDLEKTFIKEHFSV